FVLIDRNTVVDLSAAVNRRGQQLGNGHGRGIERLGGDVVGEGSLERLCDAALAGRRSIGGEIAGQHLRGGDEGRSRGKGIADARSLIAAEEEQFVLLDGTADGAAELVALEHVRSGGENVL